MAAITWMSGFFWKLRWNLLLAARKERRIAKMQRRVRRKQDGLASQLEDLENRVMLSGTTAVNDQAVLTQVGVPVTLDVLSNDVSGNGALNIVSATLTSGTGSVVIVDGDVNGTGAAARDRVRVNLSSNFTGNATIQYTIEDASGNQSTATATMSVGASLGNAFASASGGGAMTISGGTGNGHVVTPTDRYLPTESGNYEYTISQAGATYNASGASGTQGITKVVSTTSNGVANWSYAEKVTWVYEIYSNDGNGNTQHLWGGYTYTFSSVSVNGVITTTLAYLSADHYDNVKTTTTDTSIFENNYWGTVNTAITVINIDNVLDSGSIYYHNDSTTGSLGAGSYLRPMPGGSVSGTMDGDSYGFNTMTMYRYYTQQTSGGFSATGSVTMNGNGNNSFTYQGGGTYGDSSMMTTVVESGGQNESNSYNGSGTLGISGWVLSGTGYTDGDQFSNFAYSGVGSYSRAFHGGTMVGTQNTNGYNNSSSDFRIDYSLNSAGWYVTSGQNSATGNSLSHFEYEGSGGYTFTESSSGYSQTLSGDMAEDGHNHTQSNYSTEGTLDVPTMQWTYTGSGSGSGNNHDHMEYSGTGSYNRQIYGGSVTGSANEEYNHSTQGSFTTQSTLVSGDWAVTGSGSANGTSHNHTDFSGSGSYSRTEGEGANQITYSGTQKQDGHTTIDQGWNTVSSLAVTGLVTTNGSGSGTTDTHSYTYFSGSATYSRQTADGLGSISGTKKEEREDYQSNVANTQTTSFDQEYGGFGGASGSGSIGTGWSITTGSASGNGHGFANTSWSGSGSYSKSWSDSLGNGSANYSGSVFTEEKGHSKSNYSASSKSTLDAQGNWFRTSGSGESSGNNYDYAYTKSEGSYNKNTSGANGYQSTYSGGYFNSNKAENSNQWNETSAVVNGEFAQDSGNASGSGSSESISSNSGGGTYSYNGGTYNSHISGTVNEDRYAKDSSKYTTTSTWSAANGWTATGSKSGEGNSRNHTDYAGSGRMNTISSMASGYTSSSGTTSLMGSVNENGHTNTFSKYSSTATWVEGSVSSGSGMPSTPTEGEWKLQNGSGSDWGDGLTHVDWDGTGSYASGGSDNRWGTWNVSGKTTSKGHENKNNKWESTSTLQQPASGTEKVWVTVGGSGSDWGDTLNEKNHSGSGTWNAWVVDGSVFGMFVPNAYSVSGTVKQNGSEKSTHDWSTHSEWDPTAAAQASGGASGGNWKIASGSSSGTGHMDNRDEFGYSSANYVATGASWMTGSMSAYGFNQVIDDSNWTSVWSETARLPTQNPEVFTTGPGWALVSGSGRVDETSGSGKTYSGSGTYNSGGNFSVYEGGGSWNFSVAASQSGKVESGTGVFATTKVQNGEWVSDTAGVTASGFSEEKWKWDGSGSYTRGTLSGSFTEGAKSTFSDKYNFEWNESGGLSSADRDQNWESSGYNSFSASGSANLLGVSGQYKEFGGGNWSSSGTIDYDWDTSLPETTAEQLLGINYDQWVAKSGTATDKSNSNWGNGFSGTAATSGSFGGGAPTTRTASFSNSYHQDTTEGYQAVVQQAVYSLPEGGREVAWQLTSGNQTQGGDGSQDEEESSSGSYVTPVYHINGTFERSQIDHSDYNWELTSTFSGNSWTTTGSGVRQGNSETHFSYEGTESYSTTGGSGTRSESQSDNTYSNFKLDDTWVDQAGGGRPGGGGIVGPGGGRNQQSPNSGSAGYWSATGTASGSADGTWNISLNQTATWTTNVHGASIQGTQTTDYSEDYSYDSHAELELRNGTNTNPNDDFFELVSGGGSGQGNGHLTITGSASGGYSSTFDSGAGNISGTANASMRTHWDYSFDQEMTLENVPGVGQQWVVSASGSTNFDGFNNWDYSGSGSYDNTTTNANGFSRTSATWDESGHSNYGYTGTDEWVNNEWTFEWESNSDTASDTTYNRYTEYDYTYTSNANGYNNWSRSSGHANYMEEWHSDSNTTVNYNEEMASGQLTWTHKSSGENSSYHIIDSDSTSRSQYSNTYTSPNFTSFSNGYSSNVSSNYDRWDWWGTSNWEEHEDGSSSMSTSSGGSHDWNWSNSMNYSMAWGETRYYSSSASGGMSGSGMGGASSTGGSATGGYTSGSGGSSSWSFSYSSSTPADPPGSGSGGPYGDGKYRLSAGGVGLGQGSPLQTPNASPPQVSIPNLGMGSVTGFSTLGMDIWRDLSIAEAFWNGVDAIEDAFAWAGDQVRELFDTAARWIEDAGVWASQTFGWSGFEVAGSFLAGFTRGVGDMLGGMIDIPAQIHSMIDTLSNLTMEDVLDGIQGALDIVGMIPVVGEIADGINGVISLARGDYVGAALSFTSMIPVVGDAIGKGGKAARFIAKKGDDILSAGRKVVCKVTGNGCFVAGTQVWLSSVSQADETTESFSISQSLENDAGQALMSVGGAVASPPIQTTISKLAIESIPIGARVAGENPKPWEYDGELPEPDPSTWLLAQFAMQKPDGSWIDIEMIRPAEYWQTQETEEGNYIYLELPELEASGLARVNSIQPCPAIADGMGHVVTARISTRQVTDIVEVEFEGGVSVSGTPVHPIWSMRQQDWVELGDLEVGDLVWTDAGPTSVLATQTRATCETAYNIEVHGHHVYQVSDLGILVHNAGPCALGKARKKAQQMVKKGNPPYATCAMVDTKTGRVFYGFSQGGRTFLGRVASKMRHILGKVVPALNRSPLNCAEAQALNKALLAGANPKNLVSATVHTATGQAMKACANCVKTVVPHVGRNLTG